MRGVLTHLSSETLSQGEYSQYQQQFNSLVAGVNGAVAGAHYNGQNLLSQSNNLSILADGYGNGINITANNFNIGGLALNALMSLNGSVLSTAYGQGGSIVTLIPGTPPTPGTPSTPAVIGVPSTPGVIGIPSTPGVIGIPSTPGVIGVPSTPGVIAVPPSPGGLAPLLNLGNTTSLGNINRFYPQADGSEIIYATKGIFYWPGGSSASLITVADATLLGNSHVIFGSSLPDGSFFIKGTLGTFHLSLGNPPTMTQIGSAAQTGAINFATLMSNGEYLFGTNKGLFRTTSGSFTNLTQISGSGTTGAIRYQEELPGGAYLLSTNNGLFRWSGGTSTSLTQIGTYAQTGDLNSGFFNFAMELTGSRAGQYFIYTENGLFLWRGGTNTTLTRIYDTTIASTTSNPVLKMTMLTDGSALIWTKYGVGHWNGGTTGGTSDIDLVATTAQIGESIADLLIISGNAGIFKGGPFGSTGIYADNYYWAGGNSTTITRIGAAGQLGTILYITPLSGNKYVISSGGGSFVWSSATPGTLTSIIPGTLTYLPVPISDSNGNLLLRSEKGFYRVNSAGSSSIVGTFAQTGSINEIVEVPNRPGAFLVNADKGVFLWGGGTSTTLTQLGTTASTGQSYTSFAATNSSSDSSTLIATQKGVFRWSGSLTDATLTQFLPATDSGGYVRNTPQSDGSMFLRTNIGLYYWSGNMADSAVQIASNTQINYPPSIYKQTDGSFIFIEYNNNGKLHYWSGVVGEAVKAIDSTLTGSNSRITLQSNGGVMFINNNKAYEWTGEILPSSPGVIGVPSTPGVIGVPSTPGVIGVPSTPGVIGVPSTLGVIAVPFNPGTPASPGTSDQTIITGGDSAISIQAYVKGSFVEIENSVSTALNNIGALNRQITGQINFNKNIQDALSVGLGYLVDSDLDRVSAELAAIKVKKALAVESLAIANAAPNVLLRLFGG